MHEEGWFKSLLPLELWMEGTEDLFVDVCADDGGGNIYTLAKVQDGGV